VVHKLLFLTPWYPDKILPHHGVFVRDQADALSKEYEVVVISSKVDYTSFKVCHWTIEESAFGSVKEYRLTVNRSLPLLNQVIYLGVTIWISYQIARRWKPDIVHGNIAFPGGVWAFVVSRLISRPFVVSDHTSRFRDNFRSVFHRLLTIFSLRRARKVIAVSTWAAREMESVIKRPVTVIPNLIHVGEYAVQPRDHRVVQIGFLGGLSSAIHRKGLDVLLKSVASIRKDFVLHIGGSGTYLNSYKEMAQACGVFNKCRFHGFVEYVPDFMRELDFFVSSSRIEAFGMVIVEAMASGLPVVSTDSGGPADFIDGSCGLLVPTEDVEALGKAIEWMIENHKAFDGERIRLKAVNHFSASAFRRRISPLYQEVALVSS
jgi:glycosyltransferase involved in cell wall biosynthesis